MSNLCLIGWKFMRCVGWIKVNKHLKVYLEAKLWLTSHFSPNECEHLLQQSQCACCPSSLFSPWMPLMPLKFGVRCTLPTATQIQESVCDLRVWTKSLYFFYLTLWTTPSLECSRCIPLQNGPLFLSLFHVCEGWGCGWAGFWYNSPIWMSGTILFGSLPLKFGECGFLGNWHRITWYY